MRQQDLEDQLMAECTFQPQTNADRYFGKPRGKGKPKPPSKQRLSRLANTHLEREKRLQAARLQAEEQLSKECTFRPKINKKSEKILGSRSMSRPRSKNEGSAPSQRHDNEQTKPRGTTRQHKQNQTRAVQRLHEVRSQVWRINKELTVTVWRISV